MTAPGWVRETVRPDPELHSVSLCQGMFFALVFVFMRVVKARLVGCPAMGGGQGWHVGSAGLPWEGQMALEVPASLPLRLCLQVFGRAAWPCLPPADGPAEPGAAQRSMPSAFKVLGQLFARSHQFRTLVISNFQEFLELTWVLTHERPLPPPREVGAEAEASGHRAVHGWNEKYGAAYRSWPWASTS